MPDEWRDCGQGSLIFRHLALERWTEAYRCHRQSMRKAFAWRHSTGYASAIKRFRYIVENFLPLQHAAWSDDLKKVQDLLGDVHDLDVSVVGSCARRTLSLMPRAHARWQERIQEERA